MRQPQHRDMLWLGSTGSQRLHHHVRGTPGLTLRQRDEGCSRYTWPCCVGAAMPALAAHAPGMLAAFQYRCHAGKCISKPCCVQPCPLWTRECLTST
eukprot:362814-Chlamydomonas_euryale.AAC.2